MTESLPAIPDVKVLACPRYADDRGFFSETFHKHRLKDAGICVEFVQDNHSLSRERGTVRGLHYQIHPFAQDKLVRVTHGAILDVAVDLRKSSPTFGRHTAVIISAAEWNQIFVPVGFAHGFCTLEPNTEVQYKVSNDYSRDHERGIIWNDRELAIDWPFQADEAILSEKDRRLPTFADLQDLFA